MNARVRTALLLAPALLGVLVWGGVTVFGLVVAGFAAVGADEYRRLASPDGHPLERGLVAAWAAVIALGFLAPVHRLLPSTLLALGSLAYLGAWVVGPGPRPDSLTRWGAAVGAWVFVAFFLGHAIWVRQRGIPEVAFLLAVVWTGDTAAYYTGSLLGSRPLAPRVSPKKTVEGAVGGLVGAVVVAAVLSGYLRLSHGVLGGALLGGVLNVVAQMGDLIESLLKRCAGVKDSGSLFPGHGGVLDRVDAFLPTLPVYAAVLSLLGA